MNSMRKATYSQAAWLIAEGNEVLLVNNGYGKCDFIFHDTKIVNEELTELQTNEAVQKYIRGHFELRKLIGEHKRSRSEINCTAHEHEDSNAEDV
jgi:hypothetical protein